MTIRYRLTFAKEGPLRYVSHLDLAHIWGRTLRRARAPVVYSRGFNPRPKLQMAAALPLGYRSTCELIDIWLTDNAPSPEELLPRLREVVPVGLIVQRVDPVDLATPALQTLVRAATYHAELDTTPDMKALQNRIETLLALEELPRKRRTKDYDLRPLIHALCLHPPILEMTLSLTSQGAGRPDEVLDALGLDALHTPITRVALHFSTAVDAH